MVNGSYMCRSECMIGPGMVLRLLSGSIITVLGGMLLLSHSDQLSDVHSVGRINEICTTLYFKGD